MRRDPLPDPDAWEPTLTAWVASLSSDNTRTAYRADLLKFGEWCTSREAIPLQVTMRDVAAYQRSIAATGASPATSRRRSSSLSSFFDFAVASGVVAGNPVIGTQRPSTESSSSTPILDDDEIADIVSAAAALDPRAHALVALLAFDGLKLNEALALDTGDVSSPTPGTVVATIERSGRPTAVELDHRSAAPVVACAADRPGQPLFTNQRTQRLSRFGADHLLKRIAVDGTATLTANALRRYFVTSSHAAGVAVEAIRQRAGVDDVRTTQRYLIASAPDREIDTTTKPTKNKEE